MSVTAARGFVAAGVSAGIRPSGKPDVALLRSLVPAVGCAMWTRNRVQAAPVVISRRHLELARVQHTDGAEIGVFEDRHTDRTIVICALDNLGKGAAGQAVQNVNLLFGFKETAGLRLSGVLV